MFKLIRLGLLLQKNNKASAVKKEKKEKKNKLLYN